MSNNSKRSIFVRYITLSGSSFLAGVLGFLVVTLLARHFGPTGFGQISLVTTIVSYAILVSNCGTGLHAVRTVAAGKETLQFMIPTVITTRFILSVLVFATLAIATYVVPKLYDSRYLLLLFSLTLFSNSIMLMWVPQAVHRTHTIAVARLCQHFVNLLVLYGLLRMNSSLLMAPLAKLAADILVAGGLALTIRRYVSGIDMRPGLAEVRNVLRASAPIGLTQLLRGLAVASDLIILGFLTDFYEVGIYGSASKLFLFTLSLGSAYFVIMLPRMAENSAEVPAMRDELRASFRRVTPFLGGGLLVLLILAAELINFLFGSDYAEASTPFRILCVAAVANFIGRHYRQVLLAANRQDIDAKLSAAYVLIHLVSKAVLIPVLGMVGCAIGTLIGELFLAQAQRMTVNRILTQSA